MLARFSTVAGERGSPDTWRDLRGFSLKFYTSQGNYDMVGNNTPVFFVRDPMKFQQFIHSQKRRADNNLRDNDMQWDFWTLSPESAHQVTYLMGDRGVPKSWRQMNGYSSHTYMWVNAKGQKFWVKYHFKSDQGVDFLTRAEADRLAGVDSDYHTRDLFEAIERGDHPSWTLKIQIMPFDEAKTYRFNPFDLTKVWPHLDYPLIEVGRMTLDRIRPTTTPRSSRRPSRSNSLVPGIGPSPDKMLLGRIFSYADAHRARLGVNYRQIPVDRPKAPVHSYSKDGVMRVENVSDPCMRRTPGRTKSRPRNILRSRCGRPAESSSMPLTRSERTTMTSVRPERWCARSWTTPRATGWSPTSSAPQERSDRARAGARVRVLAEHRPSRRRPYRQGRQRRTDAAAE